MDEDPSAVNRRTYDQIAGQFAVQTAHMDERIIQHALRFAQQIPQGGRVLDIGCGPGRDLGWFVGNGLHAFGVDLSAGMLKEAKCIGAPALCQMEMRQLAFARESFAGVWCNAALLHLPKTELPKALVEIHRILIPGGCFFLSIQKGSGEGFEIHQLSGYTRFFARFTAKEMEQYLAQAGFLVIHQNEYEHGRTWLWLETKRSL